MLAAMVLLAGVVGMLVFSLEGYRRFTTARADGRSGIGPFTVYLVCGSIGLWVIGTIVYFGVIRH
jgi:hypothetical protein